MSSTYDRINQKLFKRNWIKTRHCCCRAKQRNSRSEVRNNQSYNWCDFWWFSQRPLGTLLWPQLEERVGVRQRLSWQIWPLPHQMALQPRVMGRYVCEKVWSDDFCQYCSFRSKHKIFVDLSNDNLNGFSNFRCLRPSDAFEICCLAIQNSTYLTSRNLHVPLLTKR